VIDHVLDGPIEQARGVIGREPGPDERYIFRYDRPQMLGVHMIGVWKPLLVTWLLEDELVEQEVLRPWIGRAKHYGDTVIEQKCQIVAATYDDIGDLP